MSANEINYKSVSKLFKEGDVIISGGGKGKIKIKEIVENGIRFQSLTGSYKGLLLYTKLNVVLDNFDKIPPDQIQHNVFQLLIKNGLFDSTHETNLYGFVREFINRSDLKKTTQLGFYIKMLIPSKKQWKSWKFVTKLSVVASYITVIMFVLYFITLIFPSSETSIPIPPDKYEIIKTNNYSGYGASFVLRIEKLDKTERKFILDIGNDLENNRVSLYLDSKNNLVYRLIDTEGESHVIKIPNSFKTFLLNTWYHIYFDYGYSKDFAFMRLYINNKMMGESYFQYKINLPEDLDLNNNELVILNDLTKSYPAKATVSLLSIQNQTFKEEEIRKLMNVSLHYLENLDTFDQH